MAVKLDFIRFFLIFFFSFFAKYGIIGIAKNRRNKPLTTTSKDIQIRELKDTIKEQGQLINSLRVALDASTAQSKALTLQINNLTEQLEFLKKKLFGTSSERRNSKIEGQINLFNEAELESTKNAVEPIIEETIVSSHKRKPKTTLKEKLKGIPVEQVICELSDEEQVCENCESSLVKIGQETVRRELEFIPAKVKVIEYVSVHYACPECKETEEPYFLKTPVGNGLMKHSLASESSVAWVMYQKYANGLPLYRQEKDWKQYGIELSRATMANWVIYCASNYLKPIYDYCHKKLLEREFLMADETRVQVLKEENRKAETNSFMWLYRSGEDGLPPIILYEYSKTRAGNNAAEFLKGFSGYLTCDGYTGYNKIPEIKRCCCWAHVRRYFVDAVPKGHEYDYDNPAVVGVEFCSKLFKLEESFKQKNYSHEKVKELRLKKAKPILEAFWCWIEKQNPIRNSRLDKAISYTINRKPYLETYLDDGRCSFSNNLSENSIRPFTVGRKGWLFCDTPAGAEASAIIYSMVEMAKANHLNIYKYLNFLLSKRPSKDMETGQMELIVPWAKDAVSECKE